ncbi:MAG: proline dehydrogenase family protein [Ignavibacteriales bacterium]|nr:proline dehydrogenase family protein [Ignavibacteriales bacterium]
MNLFNKLIVTTLPAIPKPIVRKFANRYIAGEKLVDAVRVVRELNSQGIMATLDVLGEAITTKEEAIVARNEILELFPTIQIEKLDSNVSIKLTQLGLKLDRNFCLDNVRAIVAKAKEKNNFVRIDMEDSPTTNDTLWIYRQIRKEYKNCGIVLQAYLHRTENDASQLIKEGWGHFRLSKGIYVEPEEIAFKEHDEINQNFIQVMKKMFEQKAYVGIATHDDFLVDAAYRIIQSMKLQKHEYEFQMLLGVREELRTKIVRDEHRMRVYVPFGEHWYRYSIRRFKENPQIAGYVFKALFHRNSK